MKDLDMTADEVAEKLELLDEIAKLYIEDLRSRYDGLTSESINPSSISEIKFKTNEYAVAEYLMITNPSELEESWWPHAKLCVGMYSSIINEHLEMFEIYQFALRVQAIATEKFDEAALVKTTYNLAGIRLEIDLGEVSIHTFIGFSRFLFGGDISHHLQGLMKLLSSSMSRKSIRRGTYLNGEAHIVEVGTSMTAAYALGGSMLATAELAYNVPSWPSIFNAILTNYKTRSVQDGYGIRYRYLAKEDSGLEKDLYFNSYTKTQITEYCAMLDGIEQEG